MKVKSGHPVQVNFQYVELYLFAVLTFLQDFFWEGGEAKYIVLQISIVMLIFLLFSDQILKGVQSLQGGTLPPPLEKSQQSNPIKKYIFGGTIKVCLLSFYKKLSISDHATLSPSTPIILIVT